MKPGVGLIGRKLGMTQVYSTEGEPIPVTVLEVGPCQVVQVKTLERDGYSAVQLGFGAKDPKRTLKAAAGHCARAKVSVQQVLKEFRLPAPAKTEEAKEAKAQEVFELGQTVTVELFKPGDRVNVTGRSLGKGFQGGMARWNWSGGPGGHGSMSHRAPGSIGASAYPSRVFKGQHLPGHMGDLRVTAEALEVIEVHPKENLLLVQGAVPGRDQGVVVIRRSRKPARPHKSHHHQEAASKKKEEKESKPEDKGQKAGEKDQKKDQPGPKPEGKADKKGQDPGEKKDKA